MKTAKPPLADKTIVTYFQVVKAVVASAVNKEGEQLHSRNWNLNHIGLPIVNERKQSKPAFTAKEVEQIVSRGAGSLPNSVCSSSWKRTSDWRSPRFESGRPRFC